MSASTKIAWTDSTWPVTAGCRRVSPGCENCYAERLTATRLAKTAKYRGLATMTPKGPRFTGEVRTWPRHLGWPLKWWRPRKVFVGDMSDLFHEDVTDAFIHQVFAVMALASGHTFQLVTKRPERMREMVVWRRLPYADIVSVANRFCSDRNIDSAMARAWDRYHDGLRNVWLLVSAEDQLRASERLPILLQTPAATRGVSLEPLLSRVDLTTVCHSKTFVLPEGVPLTATAKINTLTGDWTDGIDCGTKARLDWVIVGGESGPGARPCQLAWIQDIVAQCEAAGVACFVKQLGTVLARELGLKDRKGADPIEWPVAFPQEFPLAGE